MSRRRKPNHNKPKNQQPPLQQATAQPTVEANLPPPDTPAPHVESSISPAQQAANERNAQYSTGPTSEEGKAVSSQNAVASALFKNGLTRDESPEEFDAFSEDVYRIWRPEGLQEALQLDKYIQAFWRSRRGWTYEAKLYDSITDDDLLQEKLDKHRRSQQRVDREANAALKQFREIQAHKYRQGMFDAGFLDTPLPSNLIHGGRTKSTAHEMIDRLQAQAEQRERTSTAPVRQPSPPSGQIGKAAGSPEPDKTKTLPRQRTDVNQMDFESATANLSPDIIEAIRQLMAPPRSFPLDKALGWVFNHLVDNMDALYDILFESEPESEDAPAEPTDQSKSPAVCPDLQQRIEQEKKVPSSVESGQNGFVLSQSENNGSSPDNPQADPSASDPDPLVHPLKDPPSVPNPGS